MALKVRAVSLQAPATNSGQDYTISGFGTCDAALIWAGTGGNDSMADELQMSQAYWDTTNVRCVSSNTMHNVDVATNSAFTVHDSTNAVRIRDGTPSDTRTATIAAAGGGDGVTLTWAGTTSVRPYVIVVMFGGLNGAQVGTSTPNGTSGSGTTVTTTGMTPKLIFAHQEWSTLRKAIGTGWAYDNAGTTVQYCRAWQMQVISANSQGGLGYFNNGISLDMPVGVYTRQQINNGDFNSGSFVHTTTDVDNTGAELHPFYYMALDFDEDCAVFESTVTTAAGDWTPLTGASITPQAVLMMPSWSVSTNNVENSAESGTWGWYVADGTNEYQLSFADEDMVGASPATTNTSGMWAEKFSNHDDTGAIDFIASSPSFTSGTITYADANVTHAPSAKGSKVMGIAFGATSGTINTVTINTGQKITVTDGSPIQ